MTAEPLDVIAAARAWLGTPYHDQASLRGVGCDCLGLARGVWRDVVGPEPAVIPPYSRDWGEVGDREVLADNALRWMIPADASFPQPGDLVLFRMRRDAVAKHCGILTGAATFIHSYDRLGVVEEPLSQAWRRRIAFAFRYPSES
ncbi:NlpC/P60 family protein [Leisingera daeponensis]|uniref:NlpC/P60 family protein n=1 Tax=Leisingera daeponensis TaxID=405746 RepID=UPI001C964EA9|nr:NlpC/P60 family protein [Leisingera daeponensis]MBY6055376.1 C40 family peptidase [Leisingera daeponensis]